MREIIEQHGGTVEKFIGDAVMAVFGVPEIREDDAVRAVRSAAAMRDAIEALNAELERRWGVVIAVRIGVATGEVVAADHSARESFVTGDAVNVAARLEQAAAPGNVLISALTERLVRGAATAEPVSPLTLKGKSEPVIAFRLLEALSAEDIGARRPISPLVGRERERRLIIDSFDRVSKERRCRVLTVVGPPGVGKSRLVEDATAELSQRCAVLRGRCLSYGQGITFWPIEQIVKHALDGDDRLSPESTRQMIRELLLDQPDADVVAARIAALAGVGEETFATADLGWAIRRLLESLARDRPLTIVLDDIHWAEGILLDLIKQLAMRAQGPIFVIALARPELLEMRSDWSRQDEALSLLTLRPLAKKNTAALVRHLLGGARVNESVRSRILEASGGNPLFVEELLGMLIDEGHLRPEAGGWVAASDLTTIPIPDTIGALLAARLERLPDPELRVLERASVMGQVFYPSAINHLADDQLRPAIAASLKALGGRGIVRAAEPDLEGETSCRFRHILIRDAAYNRLPKETRAPLHQAFAEWLEARLSVQSGELEGIVGHHLEQAFRLREQLGPTDVVARSLGHRAAVRLGSAGAFALTRGDVGPAATLLERALALPLQEDDRPNLLTQLGGALREGGQAARAETVLSEAVEGAQRLNDASLEWRAKVELYELSISENPEQRQAEAERVIPLLEASGDNLGVAKAWRLLSWVHWGRLHLAAADDAMVRGIEFARRAMDKREEIEILAGRVVTAELGPTKVADAIEMCSQIYEAVTGNRRAEGFVLFSLSSLHGMNGDFISAKEELARAQILLEEAGSKRWFPRHVMQSAQIQRWEGDPLVAERALRKSFQVFVAEERIEWLPILAPTIIRLMCRRGSVDGIQQYLEVGPRERSPDVDSEIEWGTARAEAQAVRGDAAGAARLGQETVALTEGTDCLNTEGEVYTSLAWALRGKDRRGAANAAEIALRRFRRKGNLASAALTEKLLNELEN